MNRTMAFVGGACLFMALLVSFSAPGLAESGTHSAGASFPPELQSYHDAGQSTWARLKHRIAVSRLSRSRRFPSALPRG